MWSTIQYDPKTKATYARRLAAGKPKKVTLVVCMRKQLTILNTMMKNATHWNEKLAYTLDGKHGHLAISLAPAISIASSGMKCELARDRFYRSLPRDSGGPLMGWTHTSMKFTGTGSPNWVNIATSAASRP